MSHTPQNDSDSPLLTPAFEPADGVLDLSRPVSELLRQGTKRAHEDVETSDGAARLARGEVDREEYARWAIGLWFVYEELERALEVNSTNPVLAPTYKPSLLARGPPLSSDIAHLLSTPDWRSHPLPLSLLSSSPPQLVAYTSHLSHLSSTQPERLLAHAYVRYLGDLSGGQIIKRRLAKSLSLSDDDDEGAGGLEFFEFGKLEGGEGRAQMGDMRRIKEWFRRGMDEGVGDDRELKAALVDEANEAFRLNALLFTTLAPSPSAPSPPTYAPLTSLPSETAEEEKALTDKPGGESEWTVARFLPYLISIALAHFLLVTLGFMGQPGWEKLVAVGRWLEGKVGL